MDLRVKSDGEGRFVVYCHDKTEWRERIDLVSQLETDTKGQDVRQIILDLDNVEYITSAGLGAVFSLNQHARSIEASLAVARPSPTIRRLLDTVNLPKLMPVTETLDEARALLAGDGPES
jgi:anti-anti-sigma factor